MKNCFVVFVSVLLLLAFLAVPVEAKKGGVKVDDDGVCTDVDREHNQFTEGDTAWIWLNQAGTGSVTVQYTIACNDGTTVGCTTITLARCNRLYLTNDFTLPFTDEGPSGKSSCTMTVFVNSTCGTASPDTISGDSWIQFAD